MNQFNKISYHQVFTLLKILSTLKNTLQEFVEDSFNHQAKNFTETAHFLITLKIITVADSSLFLSETIKHFYKDFPSENAIKNILFNRLNSEDNPVSSQFHEYLENFKLSNDLLLYKPSQKSNLLQSEIRNFLMTLGIVKHVPELHGYKINESHLFFQEINHEKRNLSQSELDFILEKKRIIGLSAEKQILKHEKNRLINHPELQTEIKHISQDNVSAGYDILSWETNDKDQKPIPRYIEVKAVSYNNSKFYWSKNEITTARKNPDNYYLYLLPHLGNKRFDISKLEIIPNPITNVFENSKYWNQEIESYQFTKDI
ncbi:MAG: hypothetical protein CL785_02030 [Chloroflexi bacterium]|nr:hypothetical protein [Chloroflexota bacterium]|tara:strand:- start:679 stop:1626 length:948 start_codon:yes stop_codon:yes gene_type:complete